MKQTQQNPRRAVIYARYSSDNQKDESIEQQVDVCRQFARENSLDVIDVYADRAVTGRKEKRAAYQKMLRDAEHDKFDVIIAYKSSRIARNMMTALNFHAKMEECHIETLYAKEEFGNNPTGRFMLRNMMNINQFYSENLGEDVIRGMSDNAKQCKVNGSVPFGYRSKNGSYVIEESEAEIVREIFKRVLTGENYTDICEDLNNRGYRTKTGSPWVLSAISRTISNELYSGVYRWKNIRIEDGVPAIVDKDLFDQVRAKRHRLLEVRGRHVNQSEYILTGKLFCGHCKRAMVGISGVNHAGIKYNYYKCQGRLKKVCDKKNVNRDQLEDQIVHLIMDYVLTDEVIDWMVRQYMDFIEASYNWQTVEFQKGQIKDIDIRISNLLKALETGAAADIISNRIAELQSEKRDLEQTVHEAEKQLEDFDEEHVRFFISKFLDGCIDNQNFRRQLIRQFVRKIFLYDDRVLICFTGTGTDGEAEFDLIVDDLPDCADSSVCIDVAQVRQASSIQTITLYRAGTVFVCEAIF